MLDKKSFTLIEIMFVVAIIALLASMAIPNLLRVRISANENAAIASLKTIFAALQSFKAANPSIGYPADLTLLAPPGEPAYLVTTLAIARPRWQGYEFAYTPGAVDASGVVHSCHIYSSPVVANITGVRGLYIDEGGVICYINLASGDPGYKAVGNACPAGYLPVSR